MRSHLNVSLIVRDKVTRQFPRITIFFKERRAEADSNRGPSAYQPNALPLGKTVSRRYVASTILIITTQTFRSALTTSVDSCAEMKIKCPFSGVTSSGRVWKQVCRKARLGKRVLGNPNNSRAEEPEDVDLHRLCASPLVQNTELTTKMKLGRSRESEQPQNNTVQGSVLGPVLKFLMYVDRMIKTIESVMEPF